MPGKRSAEPPPPPPVVRNGNIQFPSMRVVYSNSETGAPEWKIMNRSEALTFAKSMNLDLVVGMYRT